MREIISRERLFRARERKRERIERAIMDIVM